MSVTKRGGRAGRGGGVTLKVVRLVHGSDLELPKYQTALSAGMDLLAAVPAGKPVTLKPGARTLVPTGLIFEIPAGFEGQVRPRSGLALKHGIGVLNSPGTIDADYRGEVGVVLVNLGDKPFKIARGERIAQLVIAPVVQVKVLEAEAVTKTKRGGGGFGSTGVKAKRKVAAKVKTVAKPKRVAKKIGKAR